MKKAIVLITLVFACSFSFAQNKTTTIPNDPKAKAIEKKAKEETDAMAKYITLTDEQKERLLSVNRNLVVREMEIKEHPNNEELKKVFKKQKLRDYRSVLDGKQFHDYMQHNHIDESMLMELNN